MESYSKPRDICGGVISSWFGFPLHVYSSEGKATSKKKQKLVMSANSKVITDQLDSEEIKVEEKPYVLG